MISKEIAKTVLDLPEGDRLDLARRLVESIAVEREVEGLVAEGIRRIEEIVCGKVAPLTEDQFRAALG